MKTKLLIGGILLAVTTIARAATNDLSTTLQKGLFEEEANHNLEAAAQAYQSVAAQFDKDRKLAATAIFRLGEVYRKQGKTNEANAQYERIVREFPEQEQLVALSRSQVPPEKAVTEMLQQAQAEYFKNQYLLAQLKKLDRDKLIKALPSALPDALLNSLSEQLFLADAKLAVLKKSFGDNHPDVLAQSALVENLKEKINQRADGIMVGFETRVAADKSSLARMEEQRALASERRTAASDQQKLVTTDDEEKEIRRIRAMIQNSPDLINAPSGEPNLTPLCHAASLAQSRVAEFLLANGADVNLKRPLSSAAGGGHKAMVELLLRRGAAVDAVDGLGQAALHRAAERGFLSVTETLLAAKADLNLRDDSERTPLTLAVENGFRPVAAALLARGADPNIVSREKKNTHDRTTAGAPLHFAVVRGDEAMVTLLLTNRTDLTLRNPFGESALDIAAILGKTTIAAELLAAGADVNATGPGKGSQTPLHRAVSGNQREVVKLLLEHGAKPDATAVSGGRAGVTPLMIAAGKGEVEIVSLLLKQKADPNLLDADGITALWNALINSRTLDAVKLLLANGANPNQPDRDGFSPLIMAIGNLRDKDMAGALIDHKADVNAKDKQGMTPLHYVVQMNRKDLAELLLTNGADPNLRTNDGVTPLDLVKSKPGELAELLRKHGALDELPDFNSIRLSRGTLKPISVFAMDTATNNHFTLFEALFGYYGRSSSSTTGGWISPDKEMAFPDLNAIRIQRLSGKKLNERREIVVNALNGTNGFDCAKDVALEFGDVIEIPEREYTLAESGRHIGLTMEQRTSLEKCTERKVRFVARTETAEVTVSGRTALLWEVIGHPQVQKILRSTSDLSHVKVKRADSRNGRKVEIVATAQNPKPNEHVWLRDGDVVEVPDKP